VSTPQESKGVNNAKVIAPGMFRISPDMVSKEAKKVPNTVTASSRTKLITVSQPSVLTKKDINSNLNGLSSTGLDNTKTRRPQPRSNTKNDRVPSASKSSRSMNKEVKVEEHHRNLLLSRKNKHISSACNNSKFDYQDVISKVVCAMCKKYLNSVNHDVCLKNYVHGKKSRGRKRKANVSKNETQQKNQPEIKKPKNVGTHKSYPDLFMVRRLRNDLVACLLKFKYHKEHLFPSCEQGKSKRESYPPKPVPNSKQRLHLLHMDLCGPMRIASINGNSKPGLQCMTSGQISSGLDLTYAPSTITKQQPTEGELFEAMYDDYIGGQQSATARTVSPAQEPQVRQSSTASTTIADTDPIPTNSSSHATNIPIT
nr:Gag-Pol polyprotein [Tanacetum cinerariifolium]